MLKWSKSRPCQPGWYWHRQFNGEKYLSPQIFQIVAITQHLIVDTGDRQWPLSVVSDDCLWAGPIQEPLPNDDCNTTHIHVKLKDGEHETQR